MKFFPIFSRNSGKIQAAGALDPEGWQVGDWAECQAAGGWLHLPKGTPATGPRLQSITRVTGVKLFRHPFQPGRKVLTLAFAAWPGDWFDASHFRKLRPRADEASAAEAEFTALVRRKPAPAPAPTPLPEHPRIEEFQ